MDYAKIVNNKYMKNKKLIFAALSAVFIIAGFMVKNPQENKNNKIQVTASFYPLYFFGSEIGGDKAEVKNITPAGSEPHDFEPAAKDIARMEKSDILILNGNLESWGEKIKNNLKGKNVIIIVAGEGLFTQPPDPHIWLSPKTAKIEIEKIGQSFVRADPANSSYYQANEKTLLEKMDKLDRQYRDGLSRCKKKDIITSHAAFGYMASAYGLNQVSIAGLSGREEPSARQLGEIVKFARKNNIKYIFFESLLSPKLSDTIAKEIGAQTLVFNPLEGLTGEEIKLGKNYFTVMEDNLKNLQKALECEN